MKKSLKSLKSLKRYRVSLPQINPHDIADIDSKYWPNGRIFRTNDGRFFEILVGSCHGIIVHVGMSEIIFEKTSKEKETVGDKLQPTEA
jgi:hypothetical protein